MNKSAGFSRQITLVGVSVGEQLGALALTLGLCLKHFGLKPFSCLALTLVLCMVLAGLDEYHQTFVPGRGMEWRDFKSDCQGISVGLILVGLSYGLLHRLD